MTPRPYVVSVGGGRFRTERVFNTFAWDESLLTYRRVSAAFKDGSFSFDHGEQPYGAAPADAQELIAELTFKPAVRVGAAYLLLDELTVSRPADGNDHDSDQDRQGAGAGRDAGGDAHRGNHDGRYGTRRQSEVGDHQDRGSGVPFHQPGQPGSTAGRYARRGGERTRGGEQPHGAGRAGRSAGGYAATLLLAKAHALSFALLFRLSLYPIPASSMGYVASSSFSAMRLTSTLICSSPYSRNR